MKKSCKNCGLLKCGGNGGSYAACKSWRKKPLSGRQVLNRIAHQCELWNVVNKERLFVSEVEALVKQIRREC